ncbi:MAG: hypothetical protein B6I19_00910 [Bacteroidetes bacterium 4572_114]|nr:MAG: hypothetical protein B6I19_00910 [Bacteroidetes bacterium 4572_114]
MIINVDFTLNIIELPQLSKLLSTKFVYYFRLLKVTNANMLTMFSDEDFRWSNGFLIRCIRVNLHRFFQIPRRAFIFKRT